MKRSVFAFLFLLWPALALAQTMGGGLNAVTPPCTNFGTTAGSCAQGNDSRITGAATNNLSNVTLSGDCTNANSAVTCTKTNGAAFSPSATTDTTNASNVTSGTLGAAELGNSLGVRAKLVGANLNTTADQSITISLPIGSTNYRFNSITVSNPSISMTTAVCGVWTGAGKTGTTIVGSGAAGVAMSGLTTNTAGASGSMIGATINNITTAMYNNTTLFFACSTAQGATATADVNIAIILIN